MRRAALLGTCVLLLLAVAQPASAASKPASKRVISGIKKLPRAARTLPRRQRATTKRVAKKALRLARKGQICKLRTALIALPLNPEKLGPAVNKLNRALFKDKRVKKCKSAKLDSVKAATTTGKSILNDGAPFDTVGKPGPANKEEGENEGLAELPPGPDNPPDPSVHPPVDPGTSTEATAAANTDDMTFIARALGTPTAFKSLGDPLDPVVASSGNVVVAGGNAYIAFSDDGGRNFSYFDPVKIFPDEPDGGLCCDFQISYVKSIDAFLLLEQYECLPKGPQRCDGAGSHNRYRLAWAKPSDLVAGGGVKGWKEWLDIPSPGGTNARWFDRPDMAVGSNFVYLTWDEFRGFEDPKDTTPKEGNGKTKESANAGATMARIPLSALKPDGVSNSYTLTRAHDDNWFLPVLAQSPATVAYAFRSISDSELAMMRWPESAGRPTSDSIPHEKVGTEGCKVGGFTQFCNNAKDDNMNAYRVTGAARQNGFNGSRIWVALSTARRKAGDKSDSENRPNSRLLVVNPNTKKVVESSTLGASGCSAGFTRLSASTNGEVAGAYMLSCADNFPNFRFALLTGTRRYNGVKSSVRGTARIGDYSGVAPEPDGKHFVAGANNLSASSYDVTFARFGRKSDPIPAAPVKFFVPSFELLLPATPAKPDLVVDSITDPFNGTVNVTVRNAGNAAAAASKLRVAFAAAGSTPGGETLRDTPALRAGESAVVNASCNPYGSSSATARADATGLVDESDETNNTRVTAVGCHLP